MKWVDFAGMFWSIIFRSSCPEVFLRKVVLKICSKFTGEHLCRSVISVKLLCNFIKIALHHGCSLVNFLLFFRTPFLKNTSGRLLLNLPNNKIISQIYRWQHVPLHTWLTLNVHKTFRGRPKHPFTSFFRRGKSLQLVHFYKHYFHIKLLPFCYDLLRSLLDIFGSLNLVMAKI